MGVPPPQTGDSQGSQLTYGESVYERKKTFYYIDTTVLLRDTSTVQFNEGERKTVKI